MNDSYLVYRALFPPFYSARSDVETGDIDLDRHYFTLRLPQIRLFGPMWSFGMNVHEVDEVRPLPGMGAADTGPASSALRALYQMQDPVRLGKLKRFHTPVFLRAEIGSFLQPTDQELHEARMSLLALDTIAPGNINGDQLRNVKASDLPVVKGQEPIVDDAAYPSICSSRSVFASPFGDPPPPVTETSSSDRGQYLPAMQLMHGAIRFRPDPRYLSTVRKQMGLGVPAPKAGDTPAANERLDTIVLLPDGFCVAGSVHLPWLAPRQAVTGWFKATFRNVGRRERLQRVLVLWFDPFDAAHEAMLAEWRGHLAQFEELLRAARGKPEQPLWLDFSASAALVPEHLFWPETGDRDVPLFSRLDAGSRVSIDSAALTLRIADPGLADNPTAVMTIQPESFELDRDGALVLITGQAGAPDHAKADPDAITARYRFDPGSGGERLSLLAGDDAKRPVVLAAPLVETAELVRSATGLPRPTPDAPQLDLLWTFTPLADGWLHWPMPNATEAALARLAPSPAPDHGTEGPSADDGISGALTFGNLPGRPGFRPGERNWSFSVANAREARIELALDTATDSVGYVRHAAASLSDVVLGFQGFATITPFRQTTQRLLPDHAERALRPVGLRAVSPARLYGIEADLWQHDKEDLHLRFEVHLSDFSFEAAADGKANIAKAATVAWTTVLRGTKLSHCKVAMLPWVWKAHPTLPAVQALPRALASLARTLPSGARALAPLRLRDAPGQGRLIYRAPVDMAAAGMAVTVSDPDATAHDVKATAFVHPNDGAPWRDEIGMAVTTLPSMTLFVGMAAPIAKPGPKELAAPGSGEIELGADWAGVSTRVAAELRHDIALRDEHNAFARAPGPTPAAPATPDENAKRQAERPLPPDPEFSPLPGNGPHGTVADSDGRLPGNGWDCVWRFLNQRAALAALDRRSMLNKGDKAYALTGVFGGTDFALAPKDGVMVDTRTAITTAGPGSALQHIGRVTLDFADKVATPGTLALHGLPATSDLAGINGSFRRGTETIALVAGTAAMDYRAGSGFTDQFGLNLIGSNSTGSLIIKRLYRQPGDAGGVRLVTLKEALVLDAATNLTFHCTDVPLRDGPGSYLASFGNDADLAGRANAAGLDSNHLAGFRWSLCHADEPEAWLVVQGLHFKPLELSEMTLRQNADIDTIRIRGELRLAVGSGKQAVTLPQSEGLALLNIARTDSGGWTLELALEGPGLTWPLAEPATFRGTTPTLHLAVLPQIESEETASLHYRFGDEDAEATIMVKRHADGSFTGKLAGNKSAGADQGMDFTALSIALKGASAPTDHAVTISYQLRLGPEGARITGTCVRDLVAGTTLLEDLKYAFSNDAGEIIDIAVTTMNGDDKSQSNASFDPRHIALCWKSVDRQECGVLGGLRAVAGAGTVMATLAPSSGGNVASYTVRQLDARAQLSLRAHGAGGESRLSLALDTLDGMQVYSLAGELAVTNVLSWPEVEVKDAGPWQTARFPANPARTFTHQATLHFDGQRLPPSALAGGQGIALMVDVSNTVACMAADAANGELREWRAFERVRLLPMTQFMAVLDAAALPPTQTGLKDADTAYSPLLARQAQPLIGFEAARHILHRGAANAGGLSGALAAQMAAYLKTAAPAALAIELSNHVLLACLADKAAMDKLRAPLLLTSIPGLAFATPRPDVDVLPSAASHPLRLALACRASTDRTLFLAATDGLDAHRFPPLEPRLASFAAARLQRVIAARRLGSPDLATEIAGEYGGSDNGAYHPVFQPVVFREEPDRKALLASADFPAAATAFHLSAMFAAENDVRPLAIGFGGSGRIDIADMFGEDGGMRDGHVAPGTVFDANVYRRAIACFRDWATHNVVPGPDLLPPRGTSQDQPMLTIQVDALSSDRASIAVVGKLVMAGQDLKEDWWREMQRWAVRLLQRVAPWAAEGMLTARAAAFGLDEKAHTMLVHVALQDYARPERSAPLPKPPLPAQPQCEMRAAMRAPAAGAVTGYMPVRVAPAAFLSDKPRQDAEPRLAANGVTLSWALDGGSGAILEAGPGDADGQQAFADFWIVDSERTAFRPSKPASASATRPYELSFALPDGYQAALPRALAPAAYPVQLAPGERDAAFSQSYAPARVATSRIAARAGAWTSTRTGLAQMPSEPRSCSARASETPVHVRQPRPAPLALNDRTRPSSHEADRHVAVTAQQGCVVHGPRASRAGADFERVGLNRAPRSRWSTPLNLAMPEGSIIGPHWDGVIVIDVGGWLGTVEDKLAWTIVGASLVHGSRRYDAAEFDKLIPATPQAKSLRFEKFTQKIDVKNSLSARDALTTLATLADVDFELNLSYADADVSLNRQIRFHLYAGVENGRGVETPVFFRFEDPEFNDRINGLAKLKRTASATFPADDLILAADVSELRPSQRIDVALALRAKSLGGAPTPFQVEGDRLMYGGKPVHLLLERLRKKDAAVPLTGGDANPVSNATGDGAAGFYLISAGRNATQVFHAMAIDSGKLVSEDSPDAALSPGDQLKLSVMAYDTLTPNPTTDPVLVSLLLDVVAQPTLPANASAFAVLLLKASDKEARVGAHLYASAPEPSLMEIVDPRDLVDGLVRRRAIYQWRSFQYFPPELKQYFALQKINAVGGSWLPGQLQGGWQTVQTLYPRIASND